MAENSLDLLLSWLPASSQAGFCWSPGETALRQPLVVKVKVAVLFPTEQGPEITPGEGWRLQASNVAA